MIRYNNVKCIKITRLGPRSLATGPTRNTHTPSKVITYERASNKV